MKKEVTTTDLIRSIPAAIIIGLLVMYAPVWAGLIFIGTMFRVIFKR